MNKNNLHIYAQSMWHSEAYIVGTRFALQKLRDAIDQTLSENHNGVIVTSFVNDGEEFDAVVLRIDNEEFSKLAVPYTSTIAKERNKDAFFPNLHWDRKKLSKPHFDHFRYDFDLGGEG